MAGFDQRVQIAPQCGHVAHEEIADFEVAGTF